MATQLPPRGKIIGPKTHHTASTLEKDVTQPPWLLIYMNEICQSFRDHLEQELSVRSSCRDGQIPKFKLARP